MTRGRPALSWTTTRRWTQGRELTASIGIALVVLLLVGAGASFAARWTAQRQSLDEAERRTARLAEVLEPQLADFLTGRPGAEADLVDDTSDRISPDDLTEMTVWGRDGRVLFSNDPATIGSVAPVEGELSEAFTTGKSAADIQTGVPEADKASGEYAEDGATRYVEVYVPLEVGGYGTVAVEAYYDYDRVERLTHGLFLLLMPLVLLPLVALQAIQLPIAASLTRRVRRHQHERAELLQEALEGSDRERVRFAADLHDGPIQDLAGIGYALGVISPAVSEKHRPLMERVEQALERSIVSLRGLMTDLYPPDLQTGTLESALKSLARPLRADGVRVDVMLAETPPLPEETVNALYRVAREALANVAKHAHATAVEIRLGLLPGDHAGTDWVRLSVADDGDGLDPAAIDRRTEGHLGLRILSDRIGSLGGNLEVAAPPSGGSVVTAALPLPR